MKFMKDRNNNLGRQCDIYTNKIPTPMSMVSKRQWRLVSAMGDGTRTTHYLARRIDTNRFVVVANNEVGNLY